MIKFSGGLPGTRPRIFSLCRPVWRPRLIPCLQKQKINHYLRWHIVQIGRNTFLQYPIWKPVINFNEGSYLGKPQDLAFCHWGISKKSTQFFFFKIKRIQKPGPWNKVHLWNMMLTNLLRRWRGKFHPSVEEDFRCPQLRYRGGSTGPQIEQPPSAHAFWCADGRHHCSS